MNFSVVLVFCIAQLIVLMGVLMLERFRNIVNLLLGTVLVIIFLKFVYYLLYFNDFFLEYPQLINIIRFLQASPPAFLWFYATSIITGSIIFRKRMLLHAIPLVIGLFFFVPQIISTFFFVIIPFSLENYNKWFGLVFAEAGGVLFIFYSQYIFKELFKFYGANISLKDCLLDFNHKHLTLLKALSIMMNVYALILISGGFIAFFSDSNPTLFDYLDIGFLMVLSYLMIFILVSIPKVIHFRYSQLSKSVKLLRYEKSSLTRIEAVKYMHEMNNWMDMEKPFLNSNLSLGDLVEKLHLPGYIISETLNGVSKQNFYDYINNYRVKEFKRLANKPYNTKETNLGLAFEVGFNSKTTFNTAFKKFTGQTPSQYRTFLKNNNQESLT